MLPRLADQTVRRRLANYPAVLLVGPRQAGKTTLGRSLSSLYFDLEQTPDRLRLDLQWEPLAAGATLIVLDEAQAWPELFPRLRGTIDADRSRAGRFLLLGSVSPTLMRQVSESLAGRLALVELTPFLAVEQPATPLVDAWLRGGFPDGSVLAPERFPTWQRDYLTLLAQRDLPAWGLQARPPVTERLLRMVAALHGQLWNATQVGQSLGLSYHTVNSYVDILVGAFLLRKLPPWTANIRKRLVRSPRIYWRGSGLLHSMLGVDSLDDLWAQPWVGASWEGFVIDQVAGLLAALGEPVDPHYFRTSDGYEADLVFTRRGETWAVEAKLSSRPSDHDYRRFAQAADLIGADRRYLVTPAGDSSVGEKAGVLPLAAFMSLLQQ